MAVRAILVLGVLLGAAGGGGGDAVKKELARMQGTWRVTRMEVDGVTIPRTALAKVTIVIAGARMSFRDQGKVYEEIECVLDPARKPPEIDLRYVTGLKKGVVEKGVYELDGDTFKICQSLTRKKRPAELGSAKGSAQQMMVLKRVGP